MYGSEFKIYVFELNIKFRSVFHAGRPGLIFQQWLFMSTSKPSLITYIGASLFSDIMVMFNEVLTFISSRSRKLRMMPFLFQMMGGLRVPWMAQDSTALRPTVTVMTLRRLSSARLSWTTSARQNSIIEIELVHAFTCITWKCICNFLFILNEFFNDSGVTSGLREWLDFF